MITAAVVSLLLAAVPPTGAKRPPRRPPAAAPAVPAAPAEPPRTADRPRGTGQVVHVTAARAYLDAGADDGLAEGTALELRRGAAVAGRCTVDLVAPHHSSCAATGLRPGDTFRFAAASLPAEPRPLPPPPAEAVLERRLAAVVAAPLPLVEFKATPGAAAAPRARTAEVTVRGDVWHASTAGTSNRAAVDLVVRDAELGAGLRLDLDARAERWIRRDAPRFRPRDDTQLYLWQAQLTATPGRTLLLAAGRVLPWSIPGATVFDGAMAGVHRTFGELRAEAGAFGGLVPEPDTTEPTSSRATGGGYWILDRTLGRGAALRQEGRVAVVRSPELGTRVEGSLTGRLFLRRLDLSGEAHLGTGGDVDAKGKLDGARVDLALRPVDGLLVGGSFRHAGLAWPQPLDPPAFPGRSRAADGFASVDLARWLRLGATGGLSRDVGSGLDRRWVGPELSLPRLLGARGGLTLGYLEESGWLEGRSAYAQLTARLAALRLLLRGSWAHERSLGEDRHDLGLLASMFADLGRHVALRLSVMGRGAIDPTAGEGGSSTPYGVTGHAALSASF